MGKMRFSRSWIMISFIFALFFVLPWLPAHAQTSEQVNQERIKNVQDTLNNFPVTDQTKGKFLNKYKEAIKNTNSSNYGTDVVYGFNDVYQNLPDSEKRALDNYLKKNYRIPEDYPSPIVYYMTQYASPGQFYEGFVNPPGTDELTRIIAGAPSPEQAGILGDVSKQCYEEGNCTLCDILVVFINVANAILALLGAIAAIFFLWGAGYLLLSSGNETFVTKGKDIIKATVIGVMIVLFSWQLMNYIVIILANGSIFKNSANRVEVKLSPLGWYDVADQCKKEN